VDEGEEEKLAEELAEKLRALYRHDIYGTHGKAVAFAEHLQAWHPHDHQHCRLFHVLAGSTNRGHDYYTHFDFPGPHSIQAFIEDEYRRMALEMFPVSI